MGNRPIYLMSADCFALQADDTCRALTCGRCTYPECKFYRSVDGYFAASAMAKARIEGLPAEMRVPIEDKYYPRSK